MVSQSLSSSSTEASNRSPDLVHASTRASQEGQKEQLLDDIASSEGPVDDSSDKTVSITIITIPFVTIVYARVCHHGAE